MTATFLLFSIGVSGILLLRI